VGPGLRRDDGVVGAACFLNVIPAKAGIYATTHFRDIRRHCTTRQTHERGGLKTLRVCTEFFVCAAEQRARDSVVFASP